VTSDALDLLEQRLALPLPAPYRATMLAYPFAPDSSAAELWLLDDLPKLLEFNSKRAGSWPSGFFVIGTDGGELTYLLDTTTPPFAVVAYDVETGKLEAQAPDFEAFARLLQDNLSSIGADERAMAEAYRNKKWWQFWIRPYPHRRAT